MTTTLPVASNYQQSLDNIDAMYRNMMESGMPPSQTDDQDFIRLVQLFNHDANKKKKNREPDVSADDFYNMAPGTKLGNTKKEVAGKEVDMSKLNQRITATVRTR